MEVGACEMWRWGRVKCEGEGVCNVEVEACEMWRWGRTNFGVGHVKCGDKGV